MSVSNNWTKEQEIALINKTQEEYVDELIEKMFDKKLGNDAIKFINFTSPTGTGKTKMISRLINKLYDCFFVVTTLSRGHLNKQVEQSIKKDCLYNNYIIYGSMSYTKASILKEEDIISMLPTDKKIFWIRDEGHINTNKWSKTLTDRCYKIINFSATNKEAGGIVCNFTHTMMLRTVNQQSGTIEDAINKLIKVKESHKNVRNYNPCAIFRIVNKDIANKVEELCNEHKLKHISIVDNDNFDMQDLCEDDNEYDVIINKQKIVEGIDIRRAHVLWMENEPKNPATTIQVIGRCRRNALLWRDDIDILSKENEQLLYDTRQCFVFYNVLGMQMGKDENGELTTAFCSYISVEKLKAGHTIFVNHGQMKNGLNIIELQGCTGYYTIQKDVETGFNVVENDKFYKEERCFIPKHKKIIERYLCRLKYKPQEFWDTLKEDFKKLVFLNYFASESYEISDEIITHTCYVPHISSNGHINISSSKNIRLVDIEKENNEDAVEIKNILPQLLKHKVIYKYQQIDHFTLFEKYFEITVIDLYKIIRSKHHIDVMLYDTKNHTFLNKNATEIKNNKLIAILGCEEYKPHKEVGEILWRPSNSITDKIEHDTKLHRFLCNQYADELQQAKQQYFTGKNDFNFDPRFNSCLGYCVEYYAKYLLYGKKYLDDFFGSARAEMGIYNEKIPKSTHDIIVVRACMLKYREMMSSTYGRNVGRLIRSYTCETLSNNKDFINTVVKLGLRTATFISKNINTKESIYVDHSLKTYHIVGLADIMSRDTIIDIKCTNFINEKMVKQVLGYHFLSNFREDMHVKNVIVYDAVSGKSVNVDITNKNLQLEKPESINAEPSYIFYRNPACNDLQELIEKEKETFLTSETVASIYSDLMKGYKNCLLTNNLSMTIKQYIDSYDKLDAELPIEMSLSINKALKNFVFLKHFTSTSQIKKILSDILIKDSIFAKKIPKNQLFNKEISLLFLENFGFDTNINKKSLLPSICEETTKINGKICYIKHRLTTEMEPATIITITNNNKEMNIITINQHDDFYIGDEIEAISHAIGSDNIDFISQSIYLSHRDKETIKLHQELKEFDDHFLDASGESLYQGYFFDSDTEMEE